jgi:DNA-binding transcriptional MerR regulator
MQTVSIGDFAKMTHLSIKTLRHYHDVGLLKPAEIDSTTGYRYYARAQVATAQIIRRLRMLDMPVDEVRGVLATPDPSARGKLIAAHLERLERQLDETGAAVASLRALLLPQPTEIAVEHRTVPPTSAAAVTERVALQDVTAWMSAAFDELRGALHAQGIAPAGAPGGLWPTELFLDEDGVATVFIPARGPVRATGRVKPLVVPGAELAVIVHRGAHADLDRSYGALGTHVSERELGVDGPVREYYIADRATTSDASKWITEIAWPIFRANG